MIQIYSPANTNYDVNGDAVLMPTVCEIDTETWQLTIEHPRDPEGRWKLIEDGAVLKVPSFLEDDQLFRIFNTDKDESGVSATAQPIFFDSKNDCMLLDVRPTDKNGQQALDIMTQGTKYSGSSDITSLSTAYYVMKNLMEALTSDDENSFINRWGGEVLYNNYEVIINEKIGSDHGVQLLYGKNIPENGMNVEIDSSEVVTRIYPKAYNGRMMSNNGYVDSDNIDNYPTVKQAVMEFSDVRLAEDVQSGEDTEGMIICNSQAELDNALQAKCEEQYEAGIDTPNVTIKCDMVLLANTINYADIKELETVSLGDTIYCKNQILGVTTTSRVQSLVYDCIMDCVKSVVIGSKPYNYIDNTSSTISAADKVIDKGSNTLMADRIAGIINLLNTSLRAQKDIAQKQDVRAILFEDLDPSSSTFGALCIGTQGIQISKERNETNTDWVWGTAINFESVNADFIITGILTDKEGKFYLNLDTGELVMSDGTFKGTLNTTKDIYVGNNIYIGQGSIQSKYIRFSDNVWINLFQQSLTLKAFDSYLTLEKTTPHEEGISIIGAQLMSEGTVKLVSGSDMNCYINLQGKDNPSGEYEIDIIPGPNGKGNVNLNGNLHIYGSLDVSGQKNRVVQTKNHGKRLMNAVESADAFFEDFGTAMTDVEGFCEVKLDEIFLETVNTHCTYYIQLTAYKDGNVCIFEKGENSFKVKGTPNTQFDWRISAKQKGYEDIRMEVMKK